MNRETTLLILGVSARAAAFSALAAGLEPICGDAFADADLRRVCPASATRHYPAGLAEIALAAPNTPWMYTGALENHPALITRISKERSLLGNAPSVLVGVRDPFAVAAALAAAGLKAPELSRTPERLPRDGTWLRKPLRSSGGMGIVAWTPADQTADAQRQQAPHARHYFQKRIAGMPCAAIFLAGGGKSQLLGATEQLLAAPTPNAEFRYIGSVGPLRFSVAAANRLRHVGEVLTKRFDLVGLFGVDFIDDGRDIWPLEINPRYTASVEILERGLGFSAVGLHVAACREGRLPAVEMASDEHRASPVWHAKRVLFARQDGIVAPTTAGALLAAVINDAHPTMADIPIAGAELNAGGPILTVFGQGDSRAAALAEIDQAAAMLAKSLPV
jgi:predicted ATP-grasp superfamily ATP-dependent carboligase